MILRSFSPAQSIAPSLGLRLLPHRPPRVRLSLVVAGIAGVAVTTSLHAQVSPPDSARKAPTADTLSLDSLRARLARAEAAIALLREQLAGESESAVHTRSRFRVELFAQVLTNAFATFGRVNNIDVPQTVLPPAAVDVSPPRTDALGFSLRQTRLGATTWVDDLAGGSFVGDIDLDLFGGVQNGAGDRRLFPEPRLRTARARLIWRNTELMVGSDSPLISDLNPLTLAAVGIPDLSGAGNLWNWLGQVRVTREIGSIGRAGHEIRWAVQGAVMSPNASQVAPGDPDAADAGERSLRPALEGRLRARWGGAEGNMTVSQALIATGGGEIGVGIHRGWVAMSNGPPTAVGASRLRESHAVSVDLRAVLMRGLELRGEGYAGRLLRGLGGGGIAQNFGAPASTAPPGAVGEPVRDVAGWAQLNAQPHPAVLAGAGCGIDVVAPEQFPNRLQNTVCAAHLEWRPFQPLVIGAEYRQLATRFATGTFGARHVNLAFGFEI